MTSDIIKAIMLIGFCMGVSVLLGSRGGFDIIKYTIGLFMVFIVALLIGMMRVGMKG